MKPRWMTGISTRLIMLGLCLLLLVPALAACGGGNDEETQTEQVLKIAMMSNYGSDESWFRQQFTDLYEFANKNIKIELVPLTEQNYYGGRAASTDGKPEEPVDPMIKAKEILNGANPPDIIMMELSQLQTFIDDNLLSPLDPMITKDKFDTTDFVPTVIDGLKDMGGGKLFALAPTFTSSALFYNRALFDAQGIPYPTDEMTWDQIFDLAKLLKTGTDKNEKWGFSFNNYVGSDPFWDMQTYTGPLNLTMFDDNAEKMTVNTPQWEKVWKTISDLNINKVVPPVPDYSKEMPQNDNPGPFDQDYFLSGKVAMTIANYGYLNEIINANNNAEKLTNFTPVDWDVVTVPTHPEEPGVGGSVYMNGIMGINAKSQNAELAWNFLKFLNGEEWAKLKSRSSYEMVARKSFIEQKEGLSYNVKAFYTLTPVAQVDNSAVYTKFPGIYQVQDIGRTKFQEVLKGTKTIKLALQEWETEGNAMLKQLKTNPNGGNGGVPGVMYSESEAVEVR